MLKINKLDEAFRQRRGCGTRRLWSGAATFVTVAAVAALAVMVGCAGRDFGEDELVMGREGQIPPADVLAKGALHLPQDAPFNFTDTQRHEEGGGLAESSVEADGRARLLAEVKGEGEAWAQFRLGHILPAGRAGPMEARVHFNVKYHDDTNRAWESAPTSDLMGRLVLKAYILDSALNMIGREALTDVNPFLAPESRLAEVTPIFRFKMEPDRAYHIMLSGRIELPQGASEPVRCELVVDSVECVIEPLPAENAGA